MFDLELVERLVRLGFKRPDAQDLYAITDEGALRAAVEHVELRAKAAGLPPLDSPAAYLRDALKKGYAGASSRDGPPEAGSSDPAPAEPDLGIEEKLARLRDEWQYQRALEARSRFEAMDAEGRHQALQRFAAERVGDLPAPIAKAWHRDGIRSRIASGTFYRWLAGTLWPGEVTDTELLQFALKRAP